MPGRLLAAALLALCSLGCAPLTCPAKGGAAWTELTSAHVVLRTDAGPEKARALVDDYERLGVGVAVADPPVPRLFGEGLTSPGAWGMATSLPNRERKRPDARWRDASRSRSLLVPGCEEAVRRHKHQDVIDIMRVLDRKFGPADEKLAVRIAEHAYPGGGQNLAKMLDDIRHHRTVKV